MADYKIPVITGDPLVAGDLLRWSGAAWVNYADSAYQVQGDILDDLVALGPPESDSDGEFIVAAGYGTFAYESGATARNSLGIGTADTLTLAGLGLTGSVPALTLKNSDNEHGQDEAESLIKFTDHTGAILAQIQGHHENTADDTKGGLALSTHNGTALTEAIRVDEAQQVGVGTTPAYKFHLLGTSFFNGPMGTPSYLYFSDYNKCHINLLSAGSQIGKIGSPAANTWTLGFGATADAALGTPVLTWILGKVGIGDTDPETLLELTHAQPYLTLHNSTHEDTDGGGESRLIFKREDGAGTETAAGQIEISHDGVVANDQLAKMILSVNTGAGLAAVIEIDSSANTKIGDGGTTNYTKIEADGTLEFNGAATVFEDINMGAAMLSRPAASQPDEDEFVDENGDDTGIVTLAFAIGEKVSGSVELPHSYKTGSNITFHVHWQGIAALDTGTDNVTWQLTYTVGQNGETLDAATIISTGDIAYDTQYEFLLSSFAAIDGTNFGLEDQFIFTLERIASSGDDYAGDALVATVGLHYELDTVGSRTILTK